MSDVFISYKREDEARIYRLVQALQKHGLSVWWDRGLPGGEEWRANVEHALSAAKCVIVVWTHASVGPDGGFVRDEAARGRERGILVPVCIDRISPPLGFGELHNVDLSHWGGLRPNNASMLDLVAAIQAKTEGRPVPPARGPLTLLHRAAAMGSVAALVASVWGIGTNVLGAQQRLCAVPLGQPFISDTCGALGLGQRPTKEERIAWSTRTAGSCSALRIHIQRFPNGAYRSIAADQLSARRVSFDEQWVTAAQPLPIYVDRDAPTSSSEHAARAAALARGRSSAERLCAGFAATGQHRVKQTDVEAQEWHCSSIEGGTVCGFEGRAICTLDERQQVEQESCASGDTDSF
jgi:hypothetical protein